MKLDRKFKNVLYQKLGNQWFIFSELDNGEVIYTALPKDFNPSNKRELVYLRDEEKKSAKVAPHKNPPIETSL